MEKSGQSILERAAAAERARSDAAPAAPTSMLERAAARGVGKSPRPMSFAEAQAATAPVAAPLPGAEFALPAGPAAVEPEPTYAPAPAAAAETVVRMPLTAPPASPTTRGPRRGTIDLDRLAARGYVTPETAQSLTAEEFRLVKRQLLAEVQARGPGTARNANMILIGSAMPGEGKTFCAINLALSIAAERDLTVLLVDADVSKPEIVSRLGLQGGPGLIDVVADRSLDVGDCMIRTNIPNLTVLPAGRPHSLSTELFASERMDDIMQEIARRYTDRVILFDSPPALVTSAASVLASHVGQVVFVVAAEMTREGELKEGLALMSSCPNVQLLLNRSRFFPGGRRFANADLHA